MKRHLRPWSWGLGLAFLLACLIASPVRGGNATIWLDTTQLTPAFIANELDSHLGEYQATLEACSDASGARECEEALGKILTILKINGAPADQVSRWSALQEKAASTRAAFEAEPAKPPTQQTTPPSPPDDGGEAPPVSDFQSALDALAKNPTAGMRTAIDLCLEPTGGTPEARAKAVDEALSRVRGVIRTNPGLDSATRGKLLGEAWAAQGGYLESLGAWDAAGDAFREAAREFKAAGAGDLAKTADADADRCYEAQAGAKTPTGTGTGSGTGSSAGSGTGTSTDSPGTGRAAGTESAKDPGEPPPPP